MRSQIDFNQFFRRPKELKNKKIQSIKPNVHPDFSGIYLCVEELFSSLNYDLCTIFRQNPFVTLWKDPRRDGYFCVDNLDRFYYFSTCEYPLNVIVYKYPEDSTLINELKLHVSNQFLNYLYSFPYVIESIHPERLQFLINQYIHRDSLVELNKKYSNKPHEKISIKILAEQLHTSENKLQNQIRKRKNLIDTTFHHLENNSNLVKSIVDDPSFELIPELVWSSK